MTISGTGVALGAGDWARWPLVNCWEVESTRYRRTCPLVGGGVSAGALGAIERPPGTPPIPIFIAAVGPLVVFLAAYWGSARFRAFVLAIDLPLATAIQAWRAGGLGFLALYSHGVLPGVFAWPAGLGDIAIGVTAPWVAYTLVHKPGFATQRLFVLWKPARDPRR